MNLSKIKDLAKDQGKTMASVASAAGLTQAGLSFIIRENSTKVETLQKIAKYLNVSILEFIEDDVAAPTPANGNTATVGNKFRGNLNVGSDSNITRALDILEGQLKAKDEQISGLIKALNR